MSPGCRRRLDLRRARRFAELAANSSPINSTKLPPLSPKEIDTSPGEGGSICKDFPEQALDLGILIVPAETRADRGVQPSKAAILLRLEPLHELITNLRRIVGHHPRIPFSDELRRNAGFIPDQQNRSPRIQVFEELRGEVTRVPPVA